MSITWSFQSGPNRSKRTKLEGPSADARLFVVAAAKASPLFYELGPVRKQ